MTPLLCLFLSLLNDRSRWSLRVCVLNWCWTSLSGTTHLESLADCSKMNGWDRDCMGLKAHDVHHAAVTRRKCANFTAAFHSPEHHGSNYCSWPSILLPGTLRALTASVRVCAKHLVMFGEGIRRETGALCRVPWNLVHW